MDVDASLHQVHVSGAHGAFGRVGDHPGVLHLTCSFLS